MEAKRGIQPRAATPGVTRGHQRYWERLPFSREPSTIAEIWNTKRPGSPTRLPPTIARAAFGEHLLLRHKSTVATEILLKWALASMPIMTAILLVSVSIRAPLTKARTSAISGRARANSSEPRRLPAKATQDGSRPISARQYR